MPQDSYAAKLEPYQNAPMRLRDMSNNTPAYGTLFGTTHFNQTTAPRVPQGAPRPLTPGEYVQNPNNSWSSEISITVPHPSKPGAWTNIPSVWVVGGIPKRLTQEQAMKAALDSGLSWPEFPSAEVADRAAGTREDDWQKVGREGAAQIPPLWNKAP